MADPSPMPQVRIACGLCTGIASITTMLRLYIRSRKRRLWWDDGLAFLSMLALIVQSIVVFISPEKQNGIVRYYLIATTFYSTIWFARLSILFCIIRVVDPALHPRRVLFCVAGLFFAAWVFLITQLFWVCEPKTAWRYVKPPRCDIGYLVVACQLVTDAASDGILLFIPIRLFAVIREKRRRYRLMIAFGTCIATTIISVVHATFTFKDMSVLLTAVVEDAMSLIVCNIPVLLAAILRFRKDDIPASPDSLPDFPRAHWHG